MESMTGPDTLQALINIYQVKSLLILLHFMDEETKLKEIK